MEWLIFKFEGKDGQKFIIRESDIESFEETPKGTQIKTYNGKFYRIAMNIVDVEALLKSQGR